MGGGELDGGADAALSHVLHERGLKIRRAKLRFGKRHEVVNSERDEGDHCNPDQNHCWSTVEHPAVEESFFNYVFRLGEKLWRGKQSGYDCCGRGEARTVGEFLCHWSLEGSLGIAGEFGN